MLSGFPSTDFGATAFISTPPSPTGFAAPLVPVVATVAVVVEAVVILAAPNGELLVAPGKPVLNDNAAGAVEVFVAEAAPPKLNVGATLDAEVVVAVAVRENPVGAAVVVATGVDVFPKLNVGATAGAAVGAVVVGLGNKPNAGAGVCAAGALPKAKPDGAGVVPAVMPPVAVALVVVPKPNEGALVVGVPKLKPDMSLLQCSNFLYNLLIKLAPETQKPLFFNRQRETIRQFGRPRSQEFF